MKKITFKKNSTNLFQYLWLAIVGVAIVGALMLKNASPASINRISSEGNTETQNKQEAATTTQAQAIADTKGANEAAKKATKNNKDNAANNEAKLAKKLAEESCKKAGGTLATGTNGYKCVLPTAPTVPGANEPAVNGGNGVTAGGQSTGASCSGGNIPVKDGQTVSTGRTYNGDTTKRECVKCVNGKFDTAHSIACDVAYKQDPLNTILPVSAGKEYTGGVKVAKACIDTVKANVGNTATGRKNDKGQVCVDGTWVEKKDGEDQATYEKRAAQLIAAILCKDDVNNPAWSATTGKCGPDLEAIAKAKAEEEKAKLEAERQARLAGQCGYGFEPVGKTGCKVKDTFKISLTSAERTCNAQAGKLYDITTGLCNDASEQGRLASFLKECNSLKSSTNKTGSHSHVECDEKTGKPMFTFCGAGFDATGKCSVASSVASTTVAGTTPVTAITPTTNEPSSEKKVVNPNGKVGGTASKPGDCKYEGAYLQIGGLYVCPSEPKAVTPADNKPSQVEKKVVNPNGKVGGTASKPGDCKYEGAYLQIGGLYVCPSDGSTTNEKKTELTQQQVIENKKQGQAALVGVGSAGACVAGALLLAPFTGGLTLTVAAVCAGVGLVGGVMGYNTEPYVPPTDTTTPNTEVMAPATNGSNAGIVNPNGKVGGTASKPGDCKYEGAYLQIGGLYVCPSELKAATQKEVDTDKKFEKKVVNPNGKVGGTASKPGDCKYEGAYLQIGGSYVCPND